MLLYFQLYCSWELELWSHLLFFSLKSVIFSIRYVQVVQANSSWIQFFTPQIKQAYTLKTSLFLIIFNNCTNRNESRHLGMKEPSCCISCSLVSINTDPLTQNSHQNKTTFGGRVHFQGYSILNLFLRLGNYKISGARE